MCMPAAKWPLDLEIPALKSNKGHLLAHFCDQWHILDLASIKFPGVTSWALESLAPDFMLDPMDLVGQAKI